MKCEKCQDRGFTEQEHGLIRILCDCDKAREVAEIAGIPWRENEPVGRVVEVKDKGDSLEVIAELTPEGVEKLKEIGFIDDSFGGTRQPDRIIGSTDTGKPKQQKKPRAKKKIGKRTR